MKTPKDIAIMLGALSFIRVDGLTICGYTPGGRTCDPTLDDYTLGTWGIKNGFIVIVTKDNEMWIRCNKDLPDLTDPKINILDSLLDKLDCHRCDSLDRIFVLRNCEQFKTEQLLSRLNNPEWEIVNVI
jgi:hypothetical protein